MTRCLRVPELAAHLDLLHPARAVWKLRLGSVRLVELERHVLDAARMGWTREDDVPSSMIPQFYFNYLRGRSPLPLAGVVRHNGMDLRGLAALYGKLNSLLDCQRREETEALDLFGLSRYLHRRGERTKAESACVAARERGLPLAFDTQARRELAQMAKRRREYATAAMMWEELSEDAECRASACEELAIYHERRTKDYAKALKYASKGLQALRVTGKNSAGIYGISSAADVESLSGAVELAARYDRKIIVEEGLDAREIECAVIGNDEPEASLPGEYVVHDEQAKFLDYTEKYSSTGHVEFVVPAPISKRQTRRVQEMSVRAFKAIDGAGFARVDFFLRRDTNKLLVNELNTIPGLTDVSGFPKLWEATGVPFAKVLDRLVALAFERHEEKSRNLTSL